MWRAEEWRVREVVVVVVYIFESCNLWVSSKVHHCYNIVCHSQAFTSACSCPRPSSVHHLQEEASSRVHCHSSIALHTQEATSTCSCHPSSNDARPASCWLC